MAKHPQARAEGHRFAQGDDQAIGNATGAPPLPRAQPAAWIALWAALAIAGLGLMGAGGWLLVAGGRGPGPLAAVAAQTSMPTMSETVDDTPTLPSAQSPAPALTEILTHTPTTAPTETLTETPVPPSPAPTPTASPTSTLEPAAGATRLAPEDGTVQIYVPAGDFLMGADPRADPLAQQNEQPQHRVYLDAFWIDLTEVTNRMFDRFVQATSYLTSAERRGAGVVWTGSAWLTVAEADWRHPRGAATDITGLDDHPVVQVSWNDARAYCGWKNGQLPSEAQWEKAARGPATRLRQSGDARRFPWGNDPPAENLLNFADRNQTAAWASRQIDDGYQFTAPVGTYAAGASPYGALDMAGNVWEMVADWYSDTYYTISPADNPTGPESGTTHVGRGGAWSDGMDNVRTTARSDVAPDDQNNISGFRCAYTR